MGKSNWLNLALLATLLAFSTENAVSASSPSRLAAGVSYRNSDDACPAPCTVSGPNTFNWTSFHSMDDLNRCRSPMLLDFSLEDPVDLSNTSHRVYSCATSTENWQISSPSGPSGKANVSAKAVPVEYQLSWGSGPGIAPAASITAVSQYIGQYLLQVAGPKDRPTILYGTFAGASAGVYIGRSLDPASVSVGALQLLKDSQPSANSSADVATLQLCEDDYDADHIFGFFATSNATFGPVQDAIKSWISATCLDLNSPRNVSGQAYFTAPLLSSITGSANVTAMQNTTASNSSALAFANAVQSHLQIKRGDCRTTQVKSGDSCAALAQRCGISGNDFTKYNPSKNFCAALMPGQHVCCSSGTLPDFSPKPNSDGSCATTTVHSGMSCSSIAAANSITVDDIEDYNNNKTWAWNGCAKIWAGSIICISKGTPPMPAPLSNAICGPQVPDTKKPANMDDLANLNPCPLNACCDIWGQCGTVTEFCTKSGTGAPGTAKPGTNGCISNCGTEIKKSSVSEYRSVAYYEGFCFQRKCQYQDALQIDSSQYTHVHFGFATLTPDYQVTFSDFSTEYEFRNFRLTSGFKKILSFGGWDFSTGPSTYNILRQGTAPANRLKLATNIANFIKKYDLDGVDIDWEYPSAPDIPGIPPGDKDEGDNYLAFLVILKNLLRGKSVSIAAPASYWYLKGFPIAKISKVVDYIIYMTYDLHGQWDAGNHYSQIGCPTGNCLRSDVNLTETVNALSMITKAGVPSGKVVVGVTSYGRSFAMAEPGCYTADCQFTGTRLHSNAEPGPCTNTPGYISNAEIDAILANSSRVNQHFVDTGSNSNILVYDDVQWVAYMDSSIRQTREHLYKALSMGGTTLWATDLGEYSKVPFGLGSWSDFTIAMKAGQDPSLDLGKRHGNWTKLNCGDHYATNEVSYTSQERWDALDAKDAWVDLVADWKTFRQQLGSYDDSEFSKWFATAVNHSVGHFDCSDITVGSGCRSGTSCRDFIGDKTGPAAALIWNSFVEINLLYASYADGLTAAAAEKIDPSLGDFQKTFAPTPPKKNNEWLTILIDLVSMGTSMLGGPFVGKVIGKIPYFITKAAEDSAKEADAVKSTTTTLLTTAITIGSGFVPGSTSKWNAKTEAHFDNTLSLAMTGWNDLATEGLAELFNGKDDSLDKLTTLLADGKFAGGRDNGEGDEDIASNKEQNTTLNDAISKTFYSYAIPAIWRASDQYVFIIDTGLSCDKGKAQDIKLKGHCVGSNYYRLGKLDGDYKSCSNTGCNYEKDPGCERCSDDNFKEPHGIDSLGSAYYSGVSLEDLITGSVNTYKANGNANGAPRADPGNVKTLESLVQDDVTTPGFIRLPVCSSDHARFAWQTGKTDAKDYPCNLNDGYDDCGTSTFVDETSGASPLVSDCKQMVRNLQYAKTPGEWTTEPLEKQRQIASYKSCKFGVTGKGIHGNVNFKTGSQDIIDIVNDSIAKFASNGRVGSKGNMNCKGNIKGQSVDWGLY